MRFANSRGVRIVGAIENRAFGPVEQLAKDRLDRRQVRIKIEMLFFDVQDERVFRLEKLQRAVALVAFRDKIFAARIPMRVAARESEFPRRHNGTGASRLRAKRAPPSPMSSSFHACPR